MGRVLTRSTRHVQADRHQDVHGSLFAIAGGLLLLAAGAFVAYVNGTFIMRGPDVVGIHPSAFTWSMAGLAVVGILAVVGGALGQFVAWIGAVLNTSRLADKTWFVVLLVLGLLSFGSIAMLVYLLAGPDGTRDSASTRTRWGPPHDDDDHHPASQPGAGCGHGSRLGDRPPSGDPCSPSPA